MQFPRGGQGGSWQKSESATPHARKVRPASHGRAQRCDQGSVLHEPEIRF